MKQIVVIMAGGYGERFWPLSRMNKPKQLQCLVSNDQTMLDQTIQRVANNVSNEDIYVITNELLSFQIKESPTLTIPIENVIAEPAKKNTGPCLLFICAVLKRKYQEKGYNEQDITIAVLAADHFISDKTQFQHSFQQCCSLASNGEGIVTIGIVPTRPETGYGYINIGNEVSTNVYRATKFEEKPSLEKALMYLQNGSYLWNSGMFFWRLDYFFNELESVSKELGSFVQNFKTANAEKLVHLYSELSDISIDYTLMEQARNVFVQKATFGWDDVGSWNSLLRIKDTDIDGNIINGNVITIDTSNSLVLNYTTDENVTVATLGIDNLIVVTTDDALLVCNQDKVQDVKKVISVIKSKNFTTLL
jgi:mannose-1-phosphate guanylyltransferase